MWSFFFFFEKRAENERKNRAYRTALKPKTDETTRKQNKNYKLCFPVSYHAPLIARLLNQ
jgi:hypothetical protein